LTEDQGNSQISSSWVLKHGKEVKVCVGILGDKRGGYASKKAKRWLSGNKRTELEQNPMGEDQRIRMIKSTGNWGTIHLKGYEPLKRARREGSSESRNNNMKKGKRETSFGEQLKQC